jgi:hypothetical protein
MVDEVKNGRLREGVRNRPATVSKAAERNRATMAQPPAQPPRNHAQPSQEPKAQPAQPSPYRDGCVVAGPASGAEKSSLKPISDLLDEWLGEAGR